jgi:hypothetical protein
MQGGRWAAAGQQQTCRRIGRLPGGTPRITTVLLRSFSLLLRIFGDLSRNPALRGCREEFPVSHGKDGVAGSIPAGGSTPNQQLRPGPAPGPLHARSAPNCRLPEICQKTPSAVPRARSVVTPIRAGLPCYLGQSVCASGGRMRLGVVQQCVARVGTPGGALLSSDDYGSSVERAAKLHPL